MFALCPLGAAAGNSAPSPLAIHAAIPVLCTDVHLAARTRVRGTAVIVGANGVIRTAEHVIVESPPTCTLTLLVPNEEWSKATGFRAFFVEHCAADKTVDLAVCSLRPVEPRPAWTGLPVASLKRQFPTADLDITIAGFSGWGLFPVARRGQVKGHTLYRRQDGVYCDFSTDVVAFEGMSGSPVVTSQGELIGLITTAGTRRFSGTSFGISVERTSGFLQAHGLPLP